MKTLINNLKAVYVFLDNLYYKTTNRNPYIWAHLLLSFLLSLTGYKFLLYFGAFVLDARIFTFIFQNFVGFLYEYAQYRKLKYAWRNSGPEAWRVKRKEFFIDSLQDLLMNNVGSSWAVF